MNFVKEIWSALKRPWTETSFVFYFVFMVIGFGGIGVFMSIFQYNYYSPLFECSTDLHPTIKEIFTSSIAQNMMTYATAILIPAALSLILHVIIPEAKYKVSHTILTIAILIVIILLVCFAYIKGNMWVASIAIVVSWLFWVLANSNNDSLKDGSYNEMIKKEVKRHGQDWN